MQCSLGVRDVIVSVYSVGGDRHVEYWELTGIRYRYTLGMLYVASHHDRITSHRYLYTIFPN
jgi:hypothetical protein